jgi:uncharacterized membrane protein YfcA
VDAGTAATLVAAAFGAGAINAVAGGGSLVSFPGLLAAGYTAKVANVTNTVALLPGYFGGSLGYRSELSRQPENIRALLLPTLLGALTGSIILLATPASAFKAIVPFLIYAACALLAFQDRLAALFRRPAKLAPAAAGSTAAIAARPVEGLAPESAAPGRLPLLVGVFVAAVYGAYFGAGLGIIVLAVLGMFLPDDIQRSNALKGIIAFITNSLAAAYFAIFAHVAWSAAAVMALAALSGGYLGVGLARRLPRSALRGFVIVFGVCAATVYLIRQ